MYLKFVVDNLIHALQHVIFVVCAGKAWFATRSLHPFSSAEQTGVSSGTQQPHMLGTLVAMSRREILWIHTHVHRYIR